MTIEQKRRELFEAQWQSIRDEWVSGGLQSGGLKGLAERSFNAALDAVAIELPSDRKIRHMPAPDENQSYNEALENCRDSIESTGLGLKVLP